MTMMLSPDNRLIILIINRHVCNFYGEWNILAVKGLTLWGLASE